MCVCVCVCARGHFQSLHFSPSLTTPRLAIRKGLISCPGRWRGSAQSLAVQGDDGGVFPRALTVLFSLHSVWGVWYRRVSRADSYN